MLRHYGSKRTYTHNIRIAILLSSVAGFVNAAGFLGFSALTTNVTGHAALFAEQIARQDWNSAGTVAVWMLLFLAGAWSSSWIISRIGHHERFSFAVPIFLELMVLTFCAFYGSWREFIFSRSFFVGGLLFSMGLQNSLVSVISGSVVRTTHLTGTFTDLGIELARLKFNKAAGQGELVAKIKLHLSIVFFFMLGALFGAYLFGHILFKSFLIPVCVLCFTLFFDIFRLQVKRYYANLTYRRKSI